MKRIVLALLIMALTAGMALQVRAENGGESRSLAENLTGELRITLTGGQSKAKMTDDSIYTFVSFGEGEHVTLECDREMGGIYIMWNKPPQTWNGEADGNIFTGGKQGFLHEYVAFENPAANVTIHIPQGGQITDIYAFSPGELPQWVQVWNEPCERADLLLFSTHSDDEQLFFAGILPYYALERKVRIQVVYGTHHWDTVTRPHEQLNGLWAVGVRNYPLISSFPDDFRSLGASSESRETVLARTRKVYDEAEWVCFEVGILRRFKPQAVVNHDINGEYLHGAHILNAIALMQALELSGDATYDPDSAEKYGVWEVPKAYLHLYDQNQIVMDWDVPYDSMGGKTPFEMSKAGYACHLSQQGTWFTRWVSKERARDIEKYSPCEYGLYRTTVGGDVERNDFLENIVTYDEQERLAEEERLREEQERLAEEERLRVEQVRVAEEERLQVEQERFAEEERLKEEQESLERQKRMRTFGVAAACIGIAACVMLLFTVTLRRRRRQRRRRRRR